MRDLRPVDRLRLLGGAAGVVIALVVGSTAVATPGTQLVPAPNADGTTTWSSDDGTKVATLVPAWSTEAPVAPVGCQVTEKLVPSCGVWWGMGANPLAGESYDQALVDVERQLGRTSDLVRYYERGQTKMWPTAAQLARRDEAGKERLLYLNWKPTGLTWRQVADGAADGYLDKLAAYIGRVHPQPLMLSLNAEMEDEVVPTAGSGQTAADFRDFFRHVTERLRSKGAPNVVTSVVYIGAPHWPLKPWWNDLYPGDDVVDWIGQDPYAFGPAKNKVWRSDFPGLVDRTNPGSGWQGLYSWAATNHPEKPMVLAEWGVDETVDDAGYKPAFFSNVAPDLARYPNIKALVYWNAGPFDPVGTTRLDSSPQSLAAARAMVQEPILREPGRQLLGR